MHRTTNFARVITLLAAALAVVAWCTSAPAADRVKLLAGGQSTGNLTEMSPTEVVVTIGSTKKKTPVIEIESVQFDGEPSALAQARNAVHTGRFEDAEAALDGINVPKLDREEIVADVEFYKALVAARLALAGSGSKADAQKKLLAFGKANRNSFHFYETCELLGDVCGALGKYKDAETFYEKLSDAPWPSYKLRAGVLVGRSLVSQKKYDDAVKRFDDVIASDVSDKEADRQKLSAALGKTSALAARGKTDEAVKSVQDLIAKADPENLELHARAYNILGNCYKAAGKKKEALLAFLHVDLLYSRFPEQHAEALANLATLWSEVDKADRAAQAASLLKEKYPSSVWAEK